MFDKLTAWWDKLQARRQEKIRSDFLPEALEIVEKPASPLGAAVIWLVTAIVVFFVLWAIFGKLDEVVSARGKIVSITGTQTVQTVNGGVVKEICVKEGEHVEAGQEIAVLDAAVYEITLDNTNRNIELLEYENELLQKLLDGTDIDAPENLQDSEKAELCKYVLSLWSEYENQREELLSEDRKAQMQLASQEEVLDSIEGSRTYLTRQQEILQKAAEEKSTAEQGAERIALEIAQKEAEWEDSQELLKAGVISRAELTSLENELSLLRADYEIQCQTAVDEDYDNELRLLEVEGQLQNMDSEYAAQKEAVEIAREQGEQTEGNLETLRANFEAKINAMIVENQNRISNQRADRELQTLDVEEQRVIAPVAGVVKTLNITTEGGVLGAGQEIADIVPDDGQMMAEIEVLNQDIGYLATNQEAAMKLDTYDFQKYGKLNGYVVSIAPDALWNEQKGWVYVVKVAIDSEEFEKKHPDIAVGIGMEGTVEVKVAKRRIIAFFLEPVVEYFDGSLKVR